MKTAFSIVLLAISILPASVSAQRSSIEACNAVLIPQIDTTRLTQQDFLSYISQINQTNWEQKKNDGSFVASLTKYIPIKVGADWSNFDEARSTYFKSINYQANSDTFFGSMRSYLSDAQVKEWGRCMRESQRFGLFISESQITPTHLTLSIMWIAPPNVTQREPVESHLVGGKAVGKEIPDGSLFKEGFSLGPQEEVPVMIQRDAFTPVSVTVNVGGFSQTYSYGSTFTDRIDNLEKQLSLVRDELARFHAEYLQTFAADTGPKADKTSTQRQGTEDDGTDTITCPQGTYMYGIRVGFNKGSSHGIVYHVQPLYRPFLKKQP